MSDRKIQGRLDRQAARALFRRKLPEPVDVLNLIDFADREQYRWYGMGVVPLIYGLGGSVRWSGEWERALIGDRQAEELLVVRYPNHRRFLLMTMNPYYTAINKLRERGVARFQASFCYASVSGGKQLSQEKLLIVAHFNSDDPDSARLTLERKLARAGAEVAYAAGETSPFSFFRRFRPSDPNPLKYKQVVFFRIGAERLAKLNRNVLAELHSALPELSLQVYRRARPESLLPAPVAKLVRRFA